MGVKVTKRPDYAGMYQMIREELAGGLVACGRAIVADNVTRIDLRRDPDGNDQRPNSPGWAAMKRKERGHDVPLRYNDILIDQHGYTINGYPAMSMVSPPVSDLHITVYPTTRGVKPRDKVIMELRQRGYRYWALTEEAKAACRKLLASALQAALERITH